MGVLVGVGAGVALAVGVSVGGTTVAVGGDEVRVGGAASVGETIVAVGRATVGAVAGVPHAANKLTNTIARASIARYLAGCMGLILSSPFGQACVFPLAQDDGQIDSVLGGRATPKPAHQRPSAADHRARIGLADRAAE